MLKVWQIIWFNIRFSLSFGLERQAKRCFIKAFVALEELRFVNKREEAIQRTLHSCTGML